MAGRNVLLVELNEVPYRVLDRFAQDPRYPHLRRWLDAACTHTTLSTDVGELSPWVTWPSFHRGMNNQAHGVKNLGQDPATFGGQALWEDLRAAGHSVGLCGSLQSWPPIDPGPGGFHIPDTFAHDARCVPASVTPFQRFNLDQVAQNGAVVRGRYAKLGQLVALLATLVRLRVRPRTWLALAKQLWGERQDPTLLARRPVFQAILMWDVFRSLYRPGRPPKLATFFTNHVAGLMHRYWHQVFPEDFGAKFAGAPRPHEATFAFGVAFMDQLLGEAMAWVDRHPDSVLVVASSMGQAAIMRDDHQGHAAAVEDLTALMRALGVGPERFTTLLAMVPQVALACADPADATKIQALVASCRTASGRPFLKADVVGPSVSITIGTPSQADRQAGHFLGPEGQALPWAEAGVVFHDIEAGTAYHVPEGVLGVYGQGIGADGSRSPILATDCKALLLTLALEGRWEGPARAAEGLPPGLVAAPQAALHAR